MCFRTWDLMIMMIMPRDGYMLWYICILYNDFIRCHEDTVMLHSTTGFYKQPMIEVTYGEILFHSTEVVWEIIAREEWLGYRYDASPMFDILGSTPVWAPYILFSDFHNIKLIYIVLKSICSIKEYWWSLTLSWPYKAQRMFSTAHELFKSKTKITDYFIQILWL